MEVWGHTERSLPHTAAVTPESLRSCLGRGGIGTPHGGLGHTERSLPHTAAVTPESLRSCLGRGGIGAPRGRLWAHGGDPPHTAAVTPESLQSCLGRGGIGTPRGGSGAHGEVPPPHSGGYTRVPPVLPGPRRDRHAPWGFGGTRRGPSPTQRRLHPSPSGPAWAAEG